MYLLMGVEKYGNLYVCWGFLTTVLNNCYKGVWERNVALIAVNFKLYFISGIEKVIKAYLGGQTFYWAHLFFVYSRALW